MKAFEQSINVDFKYTVHFTRNIFNNENNILSDVLNNVDKVLVFLDSGVYKNWPELPDIIRNSKQISISNIEIVNGGEIIKNDLCIIDKIGELVIKHSLCRHSCIMVIGGGAVLDAVGFASSIIHRGIKCCRVPTTVLSMNDSGVGIKNGINRFGIKNFQGTFSTPLAVICDLNFLDTLTDRVWISGLAEAFKIGIIKDSEFLDYLMDNIKKLTERDPDITEQMIIKTAQSHMKHIAESGDPLETGNSRPLDFGHWAAHKLESMSDFQLLHGEAVAIGMAIDLQYAAQLNYISDEKASAICLSMQKVGLPINHPFLTERFSDLLKGLKEFQEHLGGKLTLAMPYPIGKTYNIDNIDLDLMQKAVTALFEL